MRSIQLCSALLLLATHAAGMETRPPGRLPAPVAAVANPAPEGRCGLARLLRQVVALDDSRQDQLGTVVSPVALQLQRMRDQPATLG